MIVLPPRNRFGLGEAEATPEARYLARRDFLRALGIAGLGALGLARGSRATGPPALTVTDEAAAARFNNFYEFTPNKKEVWRLAERLRTSPWSVEIGGLVAVPRTVDVADLARRFGEEERVYRHRCVEAWSAVIPWRGFPLRKLLDWARPLGSARYVAFTTFLDPDVAPGQARRPDWPWPYTEGLTMEEAANDLAFLATGCYGKPLPKSMGAPVRLVVPWKYGFKSIKSIVRITFTRTRPSTFWTTLAPREYGFTSNVSPGTPHARWSQATEWRIDTGERVPTLPYNGYGEWVAGMYRD